MEAACYFDIRNKYITQYCVKTPEDHHWNIMRRENMKICNTNFP